MVYRYSLLYISIFIHFCRIKIYWFSFLLLRLSFAVCPPTLYGENAGLPLRPRCLPTRGLPREGPRRLPIVSGEKTNTIQWERGTFHINPASALPEGPAGRPCSASSQHGAVRERRSLVGPDR